MEASDNVHTEPIHRHNAFAYFEALEQGVDFCVPTDDILRMIEDDVLKELQEEVANDWLSEEEASFIWKAWMLKYHPKV